MFPPRVLPPKAEVTEKVELRMFVQRVVQCVFGDVFLNDEQRVKNNN